MAKTYLEIEEVEKLENAARWPRDRLLVRIIFWGMIRVSEAVALQVEDIDFDLGTLTIKHLKTRTRILCPLCQARLSRKAKFCPGCGKEVPEPVREQQEEHKIRTIPIDSKTLELLREFFESDDLIQKDGGGLILRIGRTQAWRVIHDLAKKAKIGPLVNPNTGELRGISPHRLRDAHATLMVQKDDSTDSIRMLQEQLGHASIGTTMKYRKISGQEHLDWYRRMTTKQVAT
jgi:integrase/recombinase XerD